MPTVDALQIVCQPHTLCTTCQGMRWCILLMHVDNGRHRPQGWHLSLLPWAFLHHGVDRRAGIVSPRLPVSVWRSRRACQASSKSLFVLKLWRCSCRTLESRRVCSPHTSWWRIPADVSSLLLSLWHWGHTVPRESHTPVTMPGRVCSTCGSICPGCCRQLPFRGCSYTSHSITRLLCGKMEVRSFAPRTIALPDTPCTWNGKLNNSTQHHHHKLPHNMFASQRMNQSGSTKHKMICLPLNFAPYGLCPVGDASAAVEYACAKHVPECMPVSYTHLTLPTKRIV